MDIRTVSYFLPGFFYYIKWFPAWSQNPARFKVGFEIGLALQFVCVCVLAPKLTLRPYILEPRQKCNPNLSKAERQCALNSVCNLTTLLAPHVGPTSALGKLGFNMLPIVKMVDTLAEMVGLSVGVALVEQLQKSPACKNSLLDPKHLALFVGKVGFGTIKGIGKNGASPG